MTKRSLRLLTPLALALALALACGDEQEAQNPSRGREQAGSGRSAGRHPGGMPGGGSGRAGGPEQSPAVPVEVAAVERRDISSYIETNGILEAENEVDIVARTTGPILALEAEEGMAVRRGQRLARIDDKDIRSDVEIARVTLEESRLNYERSKRLHENRLVSPEEYEQAATRFETAQAQYENNRILLGYTKIVAPFSGRIVTRYVDLAQQVNSGTPLFRISDFDPLLCPIQVPERELPRLGDGQGAYLTVEAWPAERFPAKVLRISPVVDAATGTIKVTLDVEPDERLRPGMFARVFLETERRQDALVIPKAALSLESLGDTVYVVGDGVAERRDVTLGFREGDFAEVLSGLDESDRVVVVGQDGLSDGTPIQILGSSAATVPARQPAQKGAESAQPSTAAAGSPRTSTPGDARPPGPSPNGAGRRMDPSQMTPEQLEHVKERMRARGLSEEEIEARLGRQRSSTEDGSR